MKSGGESFFRQVNEGLRDIREGVVTGRQLRYAEEDRTKAAAAMESEIASNKKQADWIRKNAGIVRGGESIGNAFAEAIESGQAKITDFTKFLPQEFAPRDPTAVMNAQVTKQMTDLIGQIPNLQGDEREIAEYKLQALGTIAGHTFRVDAAGKAAGPLNMLDDSARAVVLGAANRNVLKSTGIQYFKDDAEIEDTKSGIIPSRILQEMTIEKTSIPKAEQPRYETIAARITQLSDDERIDFIKKGVIEIPMGEKGELEEIQVDYPGLKNYALTWNMNDTIMKKMGEAGIIDQRYYDEYTLGKAGAAEKMRQRAEDMQRQQDELQKRPSLGERIKGLFKGGIREEVSGKAEEGVFEQEAAKAQTIGDLLSPTTQTRTAAKIVGKGLRAVEETIGEQVSTIKQAPAAISKTVKDFLSTPLKTSTADIQKSRKRIATTYGNDIKEAAEKFGVPANLLVNIIQAESGGNVNATSSVGARGLMQVMPDTAKELGIDTSTSKGQIMAGAKYLAQLLKQTGGDQVRAVAAYNAGPGRLKDDAWMKIKETRNYIKKVFG